jgi:hypothetical protein
VPFREKIKTIHVVPVAASLTVLLKDRLKLLAEQGFETIGFTSYYYDEAEAIKKSGIPYLNSKYLTRKFNLLQDLKFLWESYRVFRREKPGWPGFLLWSILPGGFFSKRSTPGGAKSRSLSWKDAWRGSVIFFSR